MPMIAISGRPGSGSSTTARLLAKKLKLRHFSVGGHIKKQQHKSTEAEAIVSYWKTNGRDASYNKEMDDLAMKEARKGNVVIDGKLAIHFLKNTARFKVWLDCPLKVRAIRYSQRDKIKPEEAAKIIKDTEAAHIKYWREMYSINPFDQEFEADVVIDTSKKDSDEVVYEIIQKMKEFNISLKQ